MASMLMACLGKAIMHVCLDITLTVYILNNDLLRRIYKLLHLLLYMMEYTPDNVATGYCSVLRNSHVQSNMSTLGI